MSDGALVSIGLPVFNGAKYLRECIESVLRQTYPHFELIISDNASTDSTEDICRSYAKQDGRIKYVRQVENLGARRNFEYVLQISSHRYFMWIAADDRISEMFVEKLIGVLSRDETFAIAMSDAAIVNGSGDTLSEISIDSIRVSRSTDNWKSVRRRFFRNPTSKSYFCIYGLCRRDQLLRCELNYKGRVRYYEGLEIPFLAQVSLLGKIGTIPELLWFHRHHAESFSIRSDSRITLWQRIDNMLNISSVLLSIVRGASVGVADKAGLLWTIFWTLSKGLGGMIPGIGPLYRRLSALRRT